MPDILLAIIILFGPLAGVCGAFIAFSDRAQHPGVALSLRRSGYIWFAVLGVIYGLVIIGMHTCGGNMLYGYHNCTVIPASLANLSLPAFVLGTGTGIIYGVILAITCAVVESRNRRATR